MPIDDLLRRALLPLLVVVACLTWLLGGATTDATAADEWLALLALPLLLAAAGVLMAQDVDDTLQQMALVATAAALAVPLLQLLPLPEGLWRMSPARADILPELAAAGIQAPSLRGTLSPSAAEHALWRLLPALAIFLGTLALASRQRAVLVRLLLAIIGANVLFAFFQAGLPQDSTLCLYPAAGAGFGGLLANTNHQATALILGMVLAVGQAVHARRRAQADRAPPQAWLWPAAFAAACFLLIPLTTSRAGMVLALPALALALLLTGAIRWRRGRAGAKGLAGLAVAVLLLVIGIRAALGWMAVDQAEESRHLMTAGTLEAAAEQAPWGSGAGSFVRVFEQATPANRMQDVYVNHAHNEFVQWWLEAGVPGLLVLAFALGVLVVAGVRVLRIRGQDGHAILAAACFVGIAAVLAHSAADYPLRTIALMATTAALAGLMLGALADAGRQIRTPAVSDAAMRQA